MVSAHNPGMTLVRILVTLAGIAVIGLAALFATSLTAGASTHPTRTETQVIRQARTVYGLPATSAVCWSTGHATVSCQLFGPHGFRAIATGTVVAGQAEAAFS